MKIIRIDARQILDSRGNPTVEADVWVEGNIFGRAAVPSGASTGTHEAHELRDEGKAYNGLGVTRAVKNITEIISPALRGIRADDQFLIDEKLRALDGTMNKSSLGANALLAVSLACAHAAAYTRNILLYSHINDIAGKPAMSLPMPMMNLLNGGKHAQGSSDFQEFMVIPYGASTIAEAVQMGSETFQALKKGLHNLNVSTAVGDEGGFTFPIRQSNTEMLDLLLHASRSAGYIPGTNIFFAMDIAASEFYEQGRYVIESEERALTSEQMVAYLKEIAEKYPIISIEDGLAEDDWDGWQHMTDVLGKIQLVGDDLLVTNPERLEKAIGARAGNAILIKPNQIGTLTETLQAIKLAQERGWRTIVSHRSGETEDVSIVHLAIGTGAGQIKTGSMSRSERIAK
ncbi:MAG TPA: phosphopyruvate hydratase, partial [Candidatus Saccharibacteria bacterium]|nr:phosphopyruvate hydratase [Candidatus Saccharibacteria bacterium]